MRYVAADPRRSEIVSVGGESFSEGFAEGQKLQQMIYALIFSAIWIGIAIFVTLQSMTNPVTFWTTASYVGFFVVIGLCVFCAVGTGARARMRLPMVPGYKKPTDFVLTKLDIPYQKPTPPVAVSMAVAVEMTPAVAA